MFNIHAGTHSNIARKRVPAVDNYEYHLLTGNNMLNKLVAKTLFTSVSLLAVVSLSVTNIPTAQAQAEADAPRNLIMVVGDGMGYPYLHAYRYFKDGRGMTDQADIERTVFDRYLVGSA